MHSRANFLPLGILVVFFVFISILYLGLSWFIYAKQTLPDPFPQVKQTAYPLVGREYIPDISAQSSFVMDNTSKVVLFSKNENIRFSPASTTKIMTALVALDYYHMGDVLTVMRDSQPDWSTMGVVKGEKVTFQTLLYGMMLPSGNDAAYAIADNYPGGFSVFIAKMNEKAKLMHLVNTHYSDPAGIIDDQDYTTAHDLAILASFAITHPVLSKVVSTSNITVQDIAGRPFILKNLNELLGKYGVDGIKTGYTDEAGQVLVTSTIKNGHTIIIVVMKSENRFADTEKILQLIYGNVTYLPIHP